MARPEFNLTFRLITNGLRRSVCVDVGIYAEVSYRCVPLAARIYLLGRSGEPMFARPRPSGVHDGPRAAYGRVGVRRHAERSGGDRAGGGVRS
ncbi:hypothetical protein ZWY2020_034895 [Hordeum vulgare]|nr:hypothetical protein ZWY2020_034895 [Hordeum vulgare]